MEPLDFGGAKQCQTIALLMGVAHPHLDSERMRPSSLSKLKRSACKRVSGSGGSILCPKQFAKIDHFIARIQ